MKGIRISTFLLVFKLSGMEVSHMFLKAYWRKSGYRKCLLLLNSCYIAESGGIAHDRELITDIIGNMKTGAREVLRP